MIRKIGLMMTLILILGGQVHAITYYEKLDFVTGIVTASALNIRSGPGTNYNSVGLIYKNQYVRVFAKVGDWYVIQTENDIIGAASTKYIRRVPSSSESQGDKKESDVSTIPTELEKNLLQLINEQRKEHGLSSLTFDTALQKTARAKAEDLVANNYFSHNSPTYGTPFEMMKSFGVTYQTAGENIAGNSTLEGAVKAWMNSEGHRANILNNAYNLTGIGIVKSNTYGYVMVQMFAGR